MSFPCFNICGKPSLVSQPVKGLGMLSLEYKSAGSLQVGPKRSELARTQTFGCIHFSDTL